MSFDNQKRASLKISSIIKSEGLSLDDVSAALDAAMNRKGSYVTEQKRDIGIEATKRVLENASLTPEHKAALEVIVLGNGLRPAIDIEKDSFDQLPSVWDDINIVRAEMIPLICSVGRINISGHPEISFAGTAFVCGNNLLLTNRHLAEKFMAGKMGSTLLEFKPGMSAMIDTKEEVGSQETRFLKPTGEGAISLEWDVAILRVEGLASDTPPMPLASSMPSSLNGRTAVTIGYPAFDEAENLIDQIQIFRGVFNKKRLLPGKFSNPFPVLSYGRTVEALVHDCTTLGGCSGSAVLDISSLKVWGIHFGGESGVRNYCVPTWRLAELPSFMGFRDKMSFQ